MGSKEGTIIFGTELSRKILRNEISQTRRVVRIPNWSLDCHADLEITENGVLTAFNHWKKARQEIKPPYEAGKLLWVREAWAPTAQGYLYRADADMSPEAMDDTAELLDVKWRNPMYMPRAAARTFLLPERVCPEFLQDISESDAIAEGIALDEAFETGSACFHPTYDNPDNNNPSVDYIGAFQKLWDSINAGRGYGWDNNPAVWAVEFVKAHSLRAAGQYADQNAMQYISKERVRV